jgi:hypothetical protein
MSRRTQYRRPDEMTAHPSSPGCPDHDGSRP